MLHNEYFFAKIGVDTTENKPSKFCQIGNLVNLRDCQIWANEVEVWQHDRENRQIIL